MLRPMLVLCLTTLVAAADLESRLQVALGQVPARGDAAVAVWNCKTRAWAAVAGDPGPLRLASTTKLLISSAALIHLGTDFRFITRIHALGPIANGSVPGLGVIGGGDPTIDEHFWNGDPVTCLRQWAERIRSAGITRIAGDLVIDNRLFSGPIRPQTYPTDDGNTTKWFSAPASAFAFNDNCIDVRALPTSPGEPCRIETRPASPRITIVNRTRTVGGQGDARFMVNRANDANTITVSGSYGRPTAWFPVAIHSDPDLLAGDAFAAALRVSGITLDGNVRLGAIDPRQGALLVDHRTELLPALTLLNQRSQNFYGEQILRIIGRMHRVDPAIPGEGSVLFGAQSVREIVAPLMGEDIQGVTVLDGSGLSYGNLGSARGLCRLLAAMDASATGKLLYGTLKDKPHAGIVGKVKTGTLATTSCLAGYVDGRGGRLAFVILLSQGGANSWGWGSAMRERLYEVIAEAVR